MANRYIDNIIGVEDVKKGCSTFVYRVMTFDKTFYMRFLPEENSFSTEVLVHQKLHDIGMKVPKVLHFEVLNKQSNLSMMILDEIPGMCIEDDDPKDDLEAILYDAGKELALLHTIPVNGFGWIDKSVHTNLTAEFKIFDDWYSENLQDDLDNLKHYDFTDFEVESIIKYTEVSKSLLTTSNSVLVHGDFDISHIFHFEGDYMGLIDFGEIRGCHAFYDLATFIGFYQDEKTYQYLLAGYTSKVYLSKTDLYRIELMALFIILRFLGNKYNHKSKNHWYKLMIKQLERLKKKDI